MVPSCRCVPREDLEFTAPNPSDPTNVLILLLESWRFDAWGPEVTPNIYELAQRSIVFERHFSSGASTVAGIFGMFYGLHPTYWKAIKANNVQPEDRVLIDSFVERRFDFGVFADSEFDRHKIKNTMFRGIGIHEDFEGRNRAEQDRALNHELIGFLEGRAEDPDPFFALAFSKASHARYDYEKETASFAPARKLGLVLAGRDQNPQYVFNDSRNAVHFDDMLVGDVIAALEDFGLAKNTVILVTTDHGESFNDNGADYWGHGSNFTQYQTRVPLIAHFPGRAPRRVRATTSHIDIPPTLMREVLGVTTEADRYGDGLELLGPLPASRTLVIGGYVNHAFVLDDRVYESRPFGEKSYRIDDVNATVRPLPAATIRVLSYQLGRFHDSQVTPTATSHQPPSRPSRGRTEDVEQGG